MGIAEGMKQITRNIASSRKERRNRVSEIGKETNEARGKARGMITTFEGSRRETNRQLRQDLARDKARRKSEAAGVLGEARNILKDFEVSRKEDSARFRTEFTQGTSERRTEVKKISGDARKLLRGFRVYRRNSSSGFRKDLSKSLGSIRADVKKLMGNARSLVKGFRTSRREGGGQLIKDLAQSRVDMESGVKQILNGFNKTRGNVKADLVGASAVWQGLNPTMPGKEDKKEDQVKNPPEAEAPSAKEGIPDLETEMLAAVNEHPEGINLAGLAEGLGIAPIVLGRASKSLQDKGAVHKQGKLYFPAASDAETGLEIHFRLPLR